MGSVQARGFHFYSGDRKWLARGVTYGPFEGEGTDHPYPPPEQLHSDFAAMRQLGVNAVRLYAPPKDATLARIADEHELQLLIDIPWPKHLDVYDDPGRREMCLDMVRVGVERLRAWPAVLGIFLGNEIPPDLVRWHGARRVENLLRELYAEAKRLAPELLTGYANYPSTEYLDLGFFDFLGFNVYLHDADEFRRYLTRLRLLYPDLPILLSEIGLDSLRHGETAQAAMLETHLSLAYETGMAGAFVFSWTDEWHTGGFTIEDWGFGITDRQRRPKPAARAVDGVFRRAPRCATPERWPKVSVVVASYNGARTLRDCLLSLQDLHYPDYEVIVVDDGSTDATPQILGEFAWARVVRQDNRGLSAARNAGIAAATGEIVAFTDSDCRVDPDWLHHLVVVMETGGFAGAGGPNLTPPESGMMARAIALAPGHATHVLQSDREAEHVPGCNMAFRREILVAVNGFLPLFRKAGDDVDVIWRLQNLGHRIGFSPAAFVWHHRRSTFRAYLKQQAGYGEAEALLVAEHPERFNERGQSIWRGVIYAGREDAAPMVQRHVHYGVFGSAGYQCVYARPAGSLAHWIVSLEWWVLCLLLLLIGPWSATAWKMGAGGILVSLIVGALRARRRVQYENLPARCGLLAWFLWVVQPLVRGGARYWFRWRVGGKPEALPQTTGSRALALRPHFGRSRVLAFWGERTPDRLAVLNCIARRMSSLRWFYQANSAWEPWDLTLVVSWWFKARLTTAEEDHGRQRRLLRVRLRLVPTALLWLCIGAALLLCGALAFHDTVLARLLLVAGLAALWWSYRRALRGRGQLEDLVVEVLKETGYANMDARLEESRTLPVVRERKPGPATPAAPMAREREG